MTASESAAFTQVLSKVVDDARRTEIGDELARCVFMLARPPPPAHLTE
jgi:hypothetical protein